MKLRQSPLTLLKNQSSARSKSVFRNPGFGGMSFVDRFRIREILRNIPKYLFMIMAAFVAFVLMTMIISIILEDSSFTISLLKIE